MNPFNLKGAIREYILDILFPKFCLNCNREGSYLCEDCFYLIDILNRQYCAFCSPPKVVIDGKTCPSCQKTKNLTGLFCSASYDSFIIRKLISQFKYPPFAKELSKPLASLIMTHLIKLNKINFDNFIIIPVPLYKNKLKQRGFNQSEEIGKELSKFLKIPIVNNILIKIKKTPAQVELKKEQRKENIINAFYCQKPEIIKDKKILLADDILTTGSTMEECAKILKQSEAKEVWGIIIARG